MIISYLTKNLYINTIIVILIFILDRFSKIYVMNLDKVNYSSELYQSKYLNISLVWNEGIAFGLLSFNESFGYNIVTIIILFVIIVLVLMLNNAKNLSRLALLLILGGALGNFFDRAYYSAVPDFIDFYYKGFHWFIFNVADVFITIGVFCLILDELFFYKKNNEFE